MKQLSLYEYVRCHLLFIRHSRALIVFIKMLSARDATTSTCKMPGSEIFPQRAPPLRRVESQKGAEPLRKRKEISAPASR